MPRSLLLVDDNPGDLSLLGLAIEDLGWEVSVATASSGAEALKHLTQAAGAKLPDLILLDLNMPVMNGWELLERMRGIEALRTVRCFAITTSSAPADCRRALTLGAERCFTKPTLYPQIVELMREIRGLSERERNADAKGRSA